MSALRFRTRHVHRTVAAYVESSLASLGWVNPPRNFGALQVHFQEVMPEENDQAITPNLVAITVGDVQDDELVELGGGTWQVIVPIFFDVYGQDGSTAVSIADDIKELVNRDTFIYLKNWTDPDHPVTLTDYIEFQSPIGPERPPASVQSNDFRKHWRVVKVLANVVYGT